MLARQTSTEPESHTLDSSVCGTHGAESSKATTANQTNHNSINSSQASGVESRFYPPVLVRGESTLASTCARAWNTLRFLYKRSDRFFHLLVGMPSYDKYVEHMRTKHPDREIKSQKEFFKEALEARYNGGVNRCC